MQLLDGSWTVTYQQLGIMLLTYFQILFTAGSVDLTALHALHIPPITSALKSLLDAPLTAEEVQHAVWNLGPWKALGLDGLPIVFNFTKITGIFFEQTS